MQPTPARGAVRHDPILVSGDATWRDDAPTPGLLGRAQFFTREHSRVYRGALPPRPVALLVLLTRPARTGVVPAHLGHGRGGRAADRTQRAAHRRRAARGWRWRGDRPGRRAHEQVVRAGRRRLL